MYLHVQNMDTTTAYIKMTRWEVWTDWSVHAENVAQKSEQNALLCHTLATEAYRAATLS